MASNDERREVAARLREQNAWTMFTNFDSCIGDLCDAVFEDEGNLNDMFRLQSQLADLIEPEPERTCRMTKKGPEFILAGWWECSECGPVYPPCNDEIATWALQKCPRCGAKVVE